MANLPGQRVRDNGVFGTITDNPLAAGATSFNSADLADLSAVSGAHALVTLDPLREHGDPEIVMITGHTVIATVATIQRAMFGTTARAHPQGTLWLHAATNDDFIRIVTSGTRPGDPYRGQLIFETDTDRYVRRAVDDTWKDLGARGLSVAPATRTTNLVLTTSEADIPGLSLTVTTEAGRRYRIAGNAGVLAWQDGGQWSGTVELFLNADGNTVDKDAFYSNTLYVSNNGKCSVEYITAPSATSHTYKLRARYIDGSQPGEIVASATRPAYILVEDIGAV